MQKPTSDKTPPWKKKRPKIGKAKQLTKLEKTKAAARAAENGRRYPNLVDNMWVLKERNK